MNKKISLEQICVCPSTLASEMVLGIRMINWAPFARPYPIQLSPSCVLNLVSNASISVHAQGVHR
jgi:hypothetical protein